MKRLSSAEAFNQIVKMGLLLGAQLEQAGDALTAPEGQSAARWKVLGRASKKEMTVAEIARSLRQSRQSVQKIADSLAADGLAVYVDNPADRRAKRLAVSVRGREVLEAIHIRQVAWARRVGKQLNSSEIEQITAALERLTAVLNEVGTDRQ